MGVRYNRSVTRICIIPKAANTGGVSSFQTRLSAGLLARGVQVTYDLSDLPFDAVLLTSTTRNIARLLALRRQGIPIVQRLDGINWLHRRLPTGFRHFLRAEYGNRLLALLRASVVTRQVYQSNFVCKWWQKSFGVEKIPSAIIHNGVDLTIYSPEGVHERPSGLYRLLIVEGSLQGGYETGLKTAVTLAELLSKKVPLELMVAGRVPPELQAAYQVSCSVPIHWSGLVPGSEIPRLDRSAHLLFSADVNAACPNAVIEALACGLPVVAFETGALPELVTNGSGCLVPYGGDPWKLDPPDLPALLRAAGDILENNNTFRCSARQKAVSAFGLELMVDRYLQVLLG